MGTPGRFERSTQCDHSHFSKVPRWDPKKSQEIPSIRDNLKFFFFWRIILKISSLSDILPFKTGDDLFFLLISSSQSLFLASKTGDDLFLLLSLANRHFYASFDENCNFSLHFFTKSHLNFSKKVPRKSPKVLAKSPKVPS